MKQLIGLGILLTALVVCSACGQRPGNGQVDANEATAPPIPVDIEETIKQRVFAAGNLYQSSSQLFPLRTEKQVETGAGDVDSFVYPVSLCLSNKNVMYISDNNAHSIRFRERDSETLGTLPKNPGTHGSLVWPNAIHYWGDSLFVSDDEGIKIFGADGSFQKLLRTYYLIKEFTIAGDGTVYINPAFRDSAASKPLIVGLNRHGTKVKEFGKRVHDQSFMGLDDQAFLSTSGSSLFAVFKHRPVINIYRSNGELYRTLSINHPIFSALKSLSTDRSFTHPVPNKFRLPIFVAGATLIGERLFVLLHLPVPEIVEFDLEGQETGRYRADTSSPITDYRGFDGQVVGNNYQFWTIQRKAKSFALLKFTGQRSAGALAISMKRSSL